MRDLLCGICVLNRDEGDVQSAVTIIGGYAVCEEEDHVSAVWKMLSMDEHEHIANADGRSFANGEGVLRA